MEASRQKQEAIFFGFSVIHFLSISFLFFKHRITFFLSIFPSLQPPSPPSFFSSHHHQPARSPPSLLIVQHYPLLIGFSLNRSLQHFFPLLAVIFIAVVELNQAPSSLPILSCLDLSIIFPLDLVFYVCLHRCISELLLMMCE